MARLGDICEIAAGQGAPQGENSYCNCNKGIPFIKAGDLSDLLSGKLETEIQCVNEIVAKQHKLKLYPAGSILFAKSGMSCMKGYVYRTKNQCYIVSHLAIVIPRGIDGEYLKYYFQHNKPNALIKDSAYPSISLQDISNIELTVPSLDTQASIASELNKVNMLISLRKKQLPKLDELVKFRFVELFGDPICNSKNLILSPLNDVCTKITDGTHDTPPRYDSGYLLITGKNIRSSGIIFDDVEFVSEEDHKIIYSRCNPEYGDVLYTNIGVNYGTACYNNLDYEFSMKNVALLKPNHRLVNGYYLWECLNIMRNHILSMNQVGGAQTFMGLANIKKIIIPVPPVELQKQFAAFAEQTDKSKFEIQKSLEKLETLKKALMQKYFG